MKTLTFAALALALCAPLAVAAPVRVVVSAPQTPITAALASLSKQTGFVILADNTVTDTLGVATLDKPGLEPMLDQLRTLAPGLQWYKITLPQSSPVPSAETLSTQVRALATLTPSTFTVTDPAAGSAMTYVRQGAALIPATNELKQTLYLVTNAKVRAARERAKQPGAGQGVVKEAVAGLQNSADALGNMSPDEQRKALPLMFEQFRNMMQNIDPAVMSEMRQNWQQRRQQGQNGQIPAPGQ